MDSRFNPAKTASDDGEWITRETFIKGKPFSYRNHEYQAVIMASNARIKFVRKCSQVGISELSLRRALAKLMRNPETNAMYVLQTAAFASTFSTTRLTSAIDNSPIVKDSLYKTDSTMIKRFLNDSYLYMAGASTMKQTISVPVDFLTLDEKDFAESQEILSSFISRLTHSEYKDQMHLSTPTVEGFGISYDFDNSLQHVELQKCNHCNHWFHADYYKHVVLPGFNGGFKGAPPREIRSLAEISYSTRSILTGFDVTKAYLACPKCSKKVDQDIKYRKFVVVNNGANYEAHGFQITPFAAPASITPCQMIRTSAEYTTARKFVTDCLGLPFDDETTGLTKEEITACFTRDVRYPDSPSYQISGTDMGGTCSHFTAHSATDGHIRIHTAKRISLHKFKVEFPKSLGENKVITSVIDGLPYTDTVLDLQTRIPYLWASIFKQTKGLSLFTISEKEEDESKATYALRQLSVKKNAMLDLVVTMLRAGKISFAPSTFAEQEEITSHLLDMKRIKIKGVDGEEQFVWQKTPRGVDHYFFALGYLVLADLIKGLSRCTTPLPFLVSKIKLEKDV